MGRRLLDSRCTCGSAAYRVPGKGCGEPGVLRPGPQIAQVA